MRRVLLLIALLATVAVSCNREFLADYIDTSIGVVDGRANNCVIGPRVPYGGIYPSPQTEKGNMDGYNPNMPIIGFGQMHVSGTGWGSYGHFLITPETGELETSTFKHASAHSQDVTKAHYYSTFLDDYGIKAEIAPAHYSAMYRFTFPEEGNIVFDASQAIASDIAPNMHGQVRNCSAEVDADGRTVRLHLKYKGGWIQGDYDLYLVAKTDAAPLASGQWENEETGHKGAFVKVAPGKVQVKTAVSFLSFENAEKLLNDEIPGWSFEKVSKAAKNEWEKKLSTIRVTGSEEDKTIFYSAMFREFTLASDRSADAPDWAAGTTFWDDNYAFWDTFRTAYPLLMLIDKPAMTSSLNAMIHRQEHNGTVYDGFIGGRDRVPEQGGNDVDQIIAESCLKGIPGVDWEKAYAIVKHNADDRRASRSGQDIYRVQGWIPHEIMSSSLTLEFACNDYSAALMAKALGHDEDAARWEARSHGWLNLWNPDLTDGEYAGFVDSREADGTFTGIPARKYGGSWVTPFYEASSWTYSYCAPHDIDTLITLMGGKEKFVERLSYGYENNLVSYENEPGFLITRLFTDAGRPDLSSYWTHSVINRGFDLRGYPQNDDTGSMASWYAFCSVGLFPFAGTDVYYLNAPVFEKAVIDLGGGKKLTMTSNASKENIYIASCKLNGKALDSAMIRHADIADGGTLEFVLDSKPTQWGQ